MRFAAAALALAAVTAATSAQEARRWELQFFHDEANSRLAFADIAFPSPRRGLAAGTLVERGREKHVVLVTSTGGERWSQAKAPAEPRSLYCLDETACWMVTSRGVYFSEEMGLTWRRVLKDSDLLRVHFVDRSRGWALGAGKKLLETRDGGRNWTETPAAAALETSSERTVFHAIAFLNSKDGFIAARSEPPRRRGPVPDWMDSEMRRERPALSVLLQTADGGKSWKASTVSMFGRMARFSSAPGNPSLYALLRYDRVFQFPSEIYHFNARTGEQTSILSRRDFAATSVAALPGGGVIAAGFEPPGRYAWTPVPGRVRILSTDDNQRWNEMEVDYRAVAGKVSLTIPDRGHAWAATDTGMILRLTKERE